MIFAGLDGYRKGWVRVTIANDAREIAFVSDIAWALRLPFDRMAVDMPSWVTRAPFLQSSPPFTGQREHRSLSLIS